MPCSMTSEKGYMELFTRVALLIIDGLGMDKHSVQLLEL